MITDEDVANHKQITAFGELRVGGLAIGGGYQAASRDDLDGVEIWANDPWTASAFVSYKIPFGKIVFIPEVVWYNSGENEAGVDEGDAVKVGVFCALSF